MWSETLADTGGPSEMQPKVAHSALLSALGDRASTTEAYADLGPLTTEAFERLPVTEKIDVRADITRFHTPLARTAELHVVSSGTTGTPITYRRTAAEMTGNAAAVADRLRAAVPGEHRILSLLDHNRFAVGPFIEAVGTQLAAPLHRGFPYRGGVLEAATVAAALAAYESDLVIATPGIVVDLEDAWDREGIDVESVTARVRSILMLGQTVTAGLRDHVAATWSASAANFSYGSSETGTIATGCSAGVLHALDDRFILEVRIDGDVAPLASSAPGELIATPLHGDATILLRYATGDVVQPVTCRCGIPGTSFVVSGREGDVVQGPQGPLGAEEVEAAIYDVPEAIDYLLDIDQRERVRQIRLLVRRRGPEPDTDALASALGAPVLVVDEIPAAARAGALVKSWKLTRTVQKHWRDR